MVVCPRCKTENDDGRIRCGNCGNNISKRGDYARGSGGPAVVVFGSVEDLRRAQQTGDIDTSEDDPTALGWLDESNIDDGLDRELSETEKSSTRPVSIHEIDKIPGLRDLDTLQKAL